MLQGTEEERILADIRMTEKSKAQAMAEKIARLEMVSKETAEQQCARIGQEVKRAEECKTREIFTKC